MIVLPRGYTLLKKTEKEIKRDPSNSQNGCRGVDCSAAWIHSSNKNFKK